MPKSVVNPESTSILVVGAGTWGSSTALHLARRGYKNVVVLDPYEVPSAISAGNDVNKIVEQGSSSGNEDDEAYVSHRLVEEATKAWETDPVFKPFYHETGYVIAASKPENIRDLEETEQPTPERGFTPLNSAEDFRKVMPEGVLTGDFPNWKGWWKQEGCGWVHAKKALVSAATEAARLGVHFITGSPQGNVKFLLIENGDVRGAVTEDGKQHRADRTILCAGACAGQLVDMKDQLRPTAWTLAHIQMTPEERRLYKNLPVLFNVERGFFMEPDEDNGELKICDEHPGYCNWPVPSEGAQQLSTPFARHQIPLVSEQGCRQFLRECMPHLADRPFSFARICWCADTPNRAFLITTHPDYPSLTLGVGGSGHGYMHITVIGGYIVDCLEGHLHTRMQKSWRWRPDTAVGRDWTDVQGRMGGSYRVLNFSGIKEDEWTKIGEPGPKL
ncbi:fructosyl amine:oxygen oxidoreductase [Teratosphaeria nubilosa]|uniref:Fructosyl amine:oxygen oxidoreductase n=1 Tax=Teratosphaeria nubilosa TaxID=161662 RepID=A0A6G1KU01_9PEZI|nr:fructosyl amine:oxygen oxidoreductase [Teratosphaeria nubilosa]